LCEWTTKERDASLVDNHVTYAGVNRVRSTNEAYQSEKSTDYCGDWIGAIGRVGWTRRKRGRLKGIDTGEEVLSTRCYQGEMSDWERRNEEKRECKSIEKKKAVAKCERDLVAKKKTESDRMAQL
jgi:hypothetical protein